MMAAKECPECARRKREEEELKAIMDWSHKAAVIIDKASSRAGRLIASGFDAIDIAEMTGFKTEYIEKLIVERKVL